MRILLGIAIAMVIVHLVFALGLSATATHASELPTSTNTVPVVIHLGAGN